jgi:hypothetical protein
MKTITRQKRVEDLQNYLWTTLEALKKKTIKAPEANAITMAAKQICDAARLELQYKMLTEGKLEKGSIPLLE